MQLDTDIEPSEEVTKNPDNPLNIEELSWTEFLGEFKWRQGEHVTMIGHTGAGKTELLIRLLPFRKRVAVFGTKGKDETMDQLLSKRGGYRKIKSWKQIPTTDLGPVYDKVLLWPNIYGIESEERAHLRSVFLNAMSSIYRSGGWCLAVDEISFLSEMLRLDGELKFMLQQGRSSGISVIGGTQRPAWVPLAFYQSATHLFLWKDNDSTNLKRLSEISGHVNKRAIMKAVQNLRGAEREGEPRETLYVNTRTGRIIKTIVEL